MEDALNTILRNFSQSQLLIRKGFPIYRRRKNDRTIEKAGILLNNSHVVPHNPTLLLKYQTHINMEWCNQSSSIKYLFKYINKGSDRISAVIEPAEVQASSSQHTRLDEIKQYLNCRYVSASEACWRIFSYSIHGRKPTVDRLFFHDEGENSVYYKDH